MPSSLGEELVFLLSLPRSGSTILSLLIGSHPDVECPPEPWFLLKLHALRFRGDPLSPYDDHLATEASNDFLDEDGFLAAARAFALSAYRERLARAGKRVFVDKTPRYYHMLPFLDRLFPRARKIWLVRDPFDTELSYRTTWGVGSDELAGEPKTPISNDFAVGLFALADYFDARSPYKCSLRYEDLVAAPRQTLEPLCDFLGIGFAERMLAYADDAELIARHAASRFGDRKALATRRLEPGSVGRWRSELSQGELQTLVDVIGTDVLARIGYADDLHELALRGVRPPDEADARERRRRIATAAPAAEEQRRVALERSVAAAAAEIARLGEALAASRSECGAAVESLGRLSSERARLEAKLESQRHLLERPAVKLLSRILGN
jgi:hypothetical protein